MAAWSKLLDCTCYELGHTWSPSCSQAGFDVAYDVIRSSFKIYAPLYLITALLRKRDKEYFKKQLLPEILQSSIFLGSNASLFIISFCIWRKLIGYYCFYNVFACGIPACALALLIERRDRRLTGSFSLLTSSFLPALLACFLAIFLERKHRRGMLALYLSNLASETAFRMAASRGIVKPMKNGEVLLFSCAMAVYMYLFRKPNGLKPALSSGLRFLVGSAELPPGDENRNLSNAPSDPASSSIHRASPSHGTSRSLLSYLPRDIKQFLHMARQGPRHKLCRHPDSCMASSAQGFLRMFGIGYAIQSGIKVLGALGNIVKRPRGLLDAITHPDNRRLGLFLGMYSAVFKAVSCALRWLRDQDSSVHGIPAGFLAGLSMMWFKSSSLAMYVTTKLVEVLYFKGIDAGYVPYIKMGDIILYTISTAFVFHAAVLEPHNLRPAYWRFLLQLTNNRFAYMNRILLDVYGTKASTLYPNFWPKLDPRFSNLKSPSA